MMKFIKKILSFPWRLLTWIRQVLANLIILAIIIIGVSAYFSTRPSVVQAPQKGALIIAPSGTIVEQLTYVDPFTMLLEEENEYQAETLLYDLTTAITYAATDNNVTALVIDPSWLQYADPSKLFSIGDAINTFKESGKPTFAIGDSFSQAQYFLASYADSIYLNPMGSVFLRGFGAYPSYFKEALDKLHINVHVFRVGSYKSFVEPFVRNDMSEQAKQNNQLWLDNLWENFSQQIEQQRELKTGTINHFINTLDQQLETVQGDSAQLALQMGFVDELVTREEMNQLIIKIVGKDKSGYSFPSIYLKEYLNTTRKKSFQTPVMKTALSRSKEIGVIIASGSILDGEQDAGSIGGDSLAKLLREVRENDSIKALVLRIDSPGGSAFASEIIRNEISLIQQADKPVIASFGGIAASGGYWIAASTDEIWATPTTITGSIGVFGIIPTFEESFASMGIHSDGVATTELANAWHLDQPMNPILEKSIQQEVEHTYDQFLTIVTQGRNTANDNNDFNKEQTHQVAQGQVWSGEKAFELKLVDHLGDLNDAIAAVAKKAELGDDYEWEFIEEQLSPKEQFFKQIAEKIHAYFPSFSTRSSHRLFRNLLFKIEVLIADLASFNDPKGVYVKCLECSLQ